MIKVEAKALVTYTCTLTEEDEQKVREYVDENNATLDEAIKELWENGEIDVYAGSQTESDCSTEEVGISPFNNNEEEED